MNLKKMNKIKEITISRSFSAKKQIKDYEPVEVFSSRSVIIEGEMPKEDRDVYSNMLYQECLDDVGMELEDLKDYQRWFKTEAHLRQQAKKKAAKDKGENSEVPF